MVITFPQHFENVFYYFPWRKIIIIFVGFGAPLFFAFFNNVDVFKIFIACNGPLALSDVSGHRLYFYTSGSAFTVYLQT